MMMTETTKPMRIAECGLRISRLPKNLSPPNVGSSSIPRSAFRIPHSESGMTLLAVMAVMAIFAMALLAVAPSVQLEVQREKELESIRRGEEIAAAIGQFIIYYQGTKLPQSIDELLDGLPQGTKNRQILRPSAATDPLSEDGKWRLIPAEPEKIASIAKRIQAYNNGALPSSPQPTQYFDKYASSLANVLNTGTESEIEGSEDEDFGDVTQNTPFIGVASQSRSKSVLAYYGVENHSKWVYTPLFRGAGVSTYGGRKPSARP